MKKRFIFDENFIKKNKRKGKMKYLLIAAVALVIIIVILVIILASRPQNPKPKPTPEPDEGKYEFKEELIIEAGSQVPKVEDYFTKLDKVDIKDITITYPEDFEVSYNYDNCSQEEMDTINKATEYKEEDYKCATKILKNPNVYGITVKVLKEEKTVYLIVQDTKAPKVEVKDVEIYKGNTYKVEDFVVSCQDVSEVCNISFIEEFDEEGNSTKFDSFTEAGTYKVKMVAKDAYQNTSDIIEANLTIIEPERQVFTIKFDSDGGSSIGDASVLDGDAVIEPVAPVKDGYNFLGWYLNNQKYDFATPVTNNITLKAKWEKISTKPPVGGGGGGGNTPPSVVGVTSVSLDFIKINLYVGDSKTVKATVHPSNATNKNVTWSTNDSSIATVNNGVITGHKAGTTYVVASAGGKSAQVEVVVRERSSSACSYGDANYNRDAYILSVNLTNNNCAIDPNLTPNENVTIADYASATERLTQMGINIQNDTLDYHTSIVKVKNTSGTGLVGYQITIRLSVIDIENPYMVMMAEYIINPDGSRNMISNSIIKNNVKFY